VNLAFKLESSSFLVSSSWVVLGKAKPNSLCALQLKIKSNFIMKALLITPIFLCSFFSFTQGDYAQLNHSKTSTSLQEFEEEILIEEIKIGCGNNFFFETDNNQHAMIVMGQWCGNSYFWTPVSLGVKISEEAFRDDKLFTGECIDRDTTGNLKAIYTFKVGKLISLIHFHKDGKIFQNYSFDAGIPHGISSVYDQQGNLQFRRTFDQGVLSGPFYETYFSDDPECHQRVEEGFYINGEREITKSECP